MSFASMLTSTRYYDTADFPLSPTHTFCCGFDLAGFFAPPKLCFLRIQKGSITTWHVDDPFPEAIVTATTESMLDEGDIFDTAIHIVAGLELREACANVPEVRPGVRCPTGEAKITPGFRLPASHVIHTVGPLYYEHKNPAQSLRNAYRNSLRLAKENNIKSIAFPAISCGVRGYPYREAAKVALTTVKEFANDFNQIQFVLFSDNLYRAFWDEADEMIPTQRWEGLL